MNNVPRRSPAISTGAIRALNLRSLPLENPSVSRLTFSLVDNTPRSLSLSILSTNPPTSAVINSPILSIPLYTAAPRILPFWLITIILDSRIPLNTSQISLNSTV